MEQEFKWDAFAALQDAVLLWALDLDATGAKLTEMDAQYFDTPDETLAAEQIALRLRRENGAGVCCLKLRGAPAADGLHRHEEYECHAANLEDGLAALPAAGAPAALCSRLRTLPLSETCRITFSRYAITLRQDDSVAELALDRGRMSSGGRYAPLCEIELEHKEGPEAPFLALGQTLAAEFHLHPQSLSKLARARLL